MHEAALMSSILETIEQKADENGITKINEIKLIVGKKSGALADALHFAFQCIAPNSFFKDAKLEIEEREVKLFCSECDLQFDAEETWDSCPTCGLRGLKILQGTELQIEYFDGD